MNALHHSLTALALTAALGSTASAQTTPFSGCGTLIQGVTCNLLFDADSAGVYLLDASLAGFSVGDRVHVSGDLDPGCITVCLQGNGCIFNSQVTGGACQPGPIGTSYCGPAVPNSSGSGAVISGFGMPLAGTTIDISAVSLPSNRFAIFLASQVQDFVPGAGGSQGVLCLGIPFARFNRPGEILFSGTSGSVTLSVDTNDIPLTPPVAVMAGETWSFQCWFRDANPGNTSNFSDGLEVTFL